MTGSALLALLALAMIQPILPRMGLRNMLRRPRQTVVLLSGLVLSTVVIAASFGLWDNLPNTSASVVAGKVSSKVQATV